MRPGAAAPRRKTASMTTTRLPILGAVLSVALALAWQPPQVTMARGAALTVKPVTWNHVGPAASQLLQPRVLLHPPGRPLGPWIAVVLAQGRGEVLQTNVRPVPAPRGGHEPDVRRRPTRTPAALAGQRSQRLPHVALRLSPPRIPAAPAPTCAVVECAPLTAIHWAAARWGASEPALVAVAQCESGLNPQAYNASGPSGLFQFLPTTYWAYARLAGETRSYWSASGSADVAAWMFAHGLANQWGCA
jgi:Transglycosylase SLT domain